MNEITKPMKAPTDPVQNEDLDYLDYPMVGSPKLDGFRCLVTDRAFTSSMKPFANLFTMRELANPVYHNLDGELVIGDPASKDAFEATSGPLRRIHGEPDFRFYVFDSLVDRHKSYEDRWLTKLPKNDGRIVVLNQKLLRNADDVLSYEKEMLNLGYEGAMIRSLNGSYKEGRCTYREMNIFKRKPFADIEGVVVGLIEAMENMNEAFIDERGLTKRSKNKENMVPKGTLGSFMIQASKWPKPFNAALGKGFTSDDKKAFWDMGQRCIGMIVTVKYQLYGSREAPRLPSVIKIQANLDS
jgi:hypothetical protein